MAAKNISLLPCAWKKGFAIQKLQKKAMKATNTFGVHFILRHNKTGDSTIYARVSVNSSLCELGLKEKVNKKHWNSARGAVRPKDDRLRQVNTYLEQVRAKLTNHYQHLSLGESGVSADSVKAAFLGLDKPDDIRTVLWLCSQHNKIMSETLRKGSLKNYFSTGRYLAAFIQHTFRRDDIPLSKVTYEFMTGLEFYIKTNPLKQHDICHNNGTMKHLERVKKMVRWAVKNGWKEKDTVADYPLRFAKSERDVLRADELASIERLETSNAMLRRARDIFIFSCYTGLSYEDVMKLSPQEVFEVGDSGRWINTSRGKTSTTVRVPLLRPAREIYDRYQDENISKMATAFPPVSNQEMNRNLKIIAGICGINKNLTFHVARHTFATTVTLMNGVPIESISKMLGHTKITTTMIYSRISQAKIGIDMGMVQEIMDRKKQQQ